MLVKGPLECRRGILMLKPANVELLGGEVSDLVDSNAPENVLARIIGKAENPNPVYGSYGVQTANIEADQHDEGKPSPTTCVDSFISISSWHCLLCEFVVWYWNSLLSLPFESRGRFLSLERGWMKLESRKVGTHTHTQTMVFAKQVHPNWTIHEHRQTSKVWTTKTTGNNKDRSFRLWSYRFYAFLPLSSTLLCSCVIPLSLGVCLCKSL